MNVPTTSTPSRQSPAVGRAFARGQLYGLLARLLAYPDRELPARVRDAAPRVVAACEYLRVPPEPFRAALDRVAAAGGDALEGAYQRCLTLTYSPDAPPYEVAYVSTDVFRQTQELADIAGFYRAFGVGVGPEERERVDHIGVELSFMHFLCLKEAYAARHREAEHLRVCRDSQRAFLRDHLLCWGPAFAERLAALGGGSPYGAAGRALAAWLEWERVQGRLAPRHVYGAPTPAEPEPEFRCAAEALIPVADLAMEERS